MSVSRGDTELRVSDILVRRIASAPSTIAVSPADFLPSLDSASLDLSTPGRARVSWPGDTSEADEVIVMRRISYDRKPRRPGPRGA